MMSINCQILQKNIEIKLVHWLNSSVIVFIIIIFHHNYVTLGLFQNKTAPPMDGNWVFSGLGGPVVLLFFRQGWSDWGNEIRGGWHDAGVTGGSNI